MFLQHFDDECSVPPGTGVRSIHHAPFSNKKWASILQHFDDECSVPRGSGVASVPGGLNLSEPPHPPVQKKVVKGSAEPVKHFTDFYEILPEFKHSSKILSQASWIFEAFSKTYAKDWLKHHSQRQSLHEKFVQSSRIRKKGSQSELGARRSAKPRH